MKKLIGILALLALVNTANAELLKNFKYDGKITVDAYSAKNTADFYSKKGDTASDANTRVELNAGFDLTEDVNAAVSAVKCDRQYGNNSQTVAGGTIDAFTFEQAYLNLKGVLGIDHKIGRQYYGSEGDLVIYYGPRNFPYAYNATPANALSVSGLDGWTGWYKNDKLTVHGLVAKQKQGAASRPDVGDIDVSGVVGKYDLMEMLNIGAYAYEYKNYNNSANAATADQTLDIAGVKADGRLSQLNLNYYGEIAKNYGHKAAGVNYTGTGFLVGAKMNLDLIGKWTFMGEFASGTGDKASLKKDEGFTTLNSDYRPGVIFSGIFGNSGLNNLTTWNLGATWNTPMFEKLTLGGKLLHYGYSEKVTSTVNAQTTDTIGNELDLTAAWQHSENVGLMAYYGAFLPTSKYTKYALDNAAAKDDMATVLGAALNVKF